MDIKVIPIGPLQTNAYLISCQQTDSAAIIDPGWSGEDIHELARRENVKLEKILLTHAHFDHVAGVAALKELDDLPVLAHPDSRPLLAQARAHAAGWGFQIADPPEIDAEIKDGQQIVVGDLELTVLFTPGHAPGHVCFYSATDKVLFDGDVLFNGSIGRYDLPGGSLDLLLNSIREKLFALPDDVVVYPGHGPSTTIGNERHWNPFLR